MKIGLVVNPVAGVGGPVALKGSDGEEIQQRARALGSRTKAGERVAETLAALRPVADLFEILAVDGAMGGGACRAAGIDFRQLEYDLPNVTSAADTRDIVVQLQQAGVDLILFAGGDGTARDICDVVHQQTVVLGIPCGVKMHSGVFAVNPAAASRILRQMIDGQLVSVAAAEVRDIDEAGFRQGRVSTRYFGEMCVPDEVRYVQHVKAGGKEVEALAVQEIAAHVVDHMLPSDTYFLGSGSTTAAVTDQLAVDGTLLGIDVIKNGELILRDAREDQLFELARSSPCHIVITFIGGQGHLLGRGNQQLSTRVIKAVGLARLQVIATRTKLKELAGRPLQVDSGDADVNRSLSGFVRITTGYEDEVLYPVAD
jgi:predicted polyphosphate/ATP-dependent NAD kinase